jgi:toxin-antitoxin system PIN domain toxin
VIVPDVNLLVYAYSATAPQHAKARAWWERTMNDEEPVGLPWAVSVGFLRLMTSAAVAAPPLRPAAALDVLESWYERRNVHVLDPGPRHLPILRGLLDELGVAGKLTADAHLAALAIEHGCELHSNDADFGRFSGVRWVNPIG